MQNAIVGYLGESGYQTISLDMAIIADDETAECLTGSIQNTFKYCGELLNSWRNVAGKMYPNQPDVPDGIPSCNDVRLVKLRKDGTIITDGCSTARKHCKLLCELIVDMSKELHNPENKISILRGTVGST
jgi:hypothetical protein